MHMMDGNLKKEYDTLFRYKVHCSCDKEMGPILRKIVVFIVLALWIVSIEGRRKRFQILSSYRRRHYG
ncbi:uncharacterized protein LOC120337361 isoform X2 [Styela clava]